MRNFFRKNKGFTLTELLSAFSISIIILLTAGTIISRGMDSWIRGEKKVNLDREAHYAVLSMAKLVREGWHVKLTDEEDEESITVFYPGPNNPRKIISLDADRSKISVQYEDDGDDSEDSTVIAERVRSLAFKPKANTGISIDLKIEDDDIQSSSSMMTAYKNRIDY